MLAQNKSVNQLIKFEHTQYSAYKSIGRKYLSLNLRARVGVPPGIIDVDVSTGEPLVDPIGNGGLRF